MSVAPPVWVVISGASQGLGAAICTELAPTLPSNSIIIGFARSKQGLENTANLVNKINNNVEFIPVSLDLCKATENDFDKALEHFTRDNSALPSQAILFHNAASLGSLKYVKDIDDSANLSSYFSLNIGSVILLNGAFLRLLDSLPSKPSSIKVINISSMAALVPFKSWGVYCTGKAAREMYHRTMAKEEPTVRVLNYGPGQLDTEMHSEAEINTGDEEFREKIKRTKLVTCETSVRKLMKILEEDEFVSGSHIEFDDQMSP